MDLATIAGVVLAVASLALGFTLDGGKLNALIQPTAVLIVLGGTLGATLTSVSLREFFGLFKYIRISLRAKQYQPLELIDTLVRLATTARREGILALEEQIEEFEDEFLRKGIQ
ncbi:MAG: motility protein A, partial [Alicyclobacillus sp.]|nr:motility protein A [Alicyclobacillus sp.]